MANLSLKVVLLAPAERNVFRDDERVAVSLRWSEEGFLGGRAPYKHYTPPGRGNWFKSCQLRGSSPMAIIDSLVTEFVNEAQTTRKHLARLPNDKLDWRPHEKSFTAGGLASHITDLISFAEWICNEDELDFNPAANKPYLATSVSDLLKTFDENVGKATEALKGVADETVMKPWRFKVMGKQLFERPRKLVLRDFVLNHQIHHRGQFSVYLRLLDVPVPSTYGPTADEP
jgi:uncharacterized damage-inducible protein DinB